MGETFEREDTFWEPGEQGSLSQKSQLMHYCACFIILLSFEKILSQIFWVESGEKARRESCFLRRQEEGEECVGICLIGLACYTYIPMLDFDYYFLFLLSLSEGLLMWAQTN